VSDEQKYTERDLILAKREGYVRHCLQMLMSKQYAETDAALLFPLPKVTRPRVVQRKDGCELRLFGTELQFRLGNDDSWKCYNGMYVDETNRLALLDLLANPTEEVDA